MNLQRFPQYSAKLEELVGRLQLKLDKKAVSDLKYRCSGVTVTLSIPVLVGKKGIIPFFLTVQ